MSADEEMKERERKREKKREGEKLEVLHDTFARESDIIIRVMSKQGIGGEMK